MKYIDAHVHFFDTDLPAGLIWPEKSSGYYKITLPRNLIDEITPGPTSVIAIETSPRESDDKWLMTLATESPLIGAVILNLGINSEAFESRLEAARQHAKFRGCRLRPIKDFDLTCRELKRKLLSLPKKASIIELGCPNNQLAEQLIKLANSLPCKHFVIDHFGHPNINPREPDALWEDRIEKLAQCQNIHCKITALTQFSTNNKADNHDYFHTLNVIEKNFGVERLLYGSNWPPVKVAGGYTQNLEILQSFFGEGTERSEQFFWKNASDLYQLSS